MVGGAVNIAVLKVSIEADDVSLFGRLIALGAAAEHEGVAR